MESAAGEDQKLNKPKRKFRPFKKPRYLVEQVGETLCKMDLKMYNGHRKRVFMAKPGIDMSPPKLQSKTLFKSFGFIQDMATLRQITLANIDLVKKINLVNRTGGKVDTYNPMANQSMSKWCIMEQRMMEISRQNKTFYRRLLKIQPNYKNTELEQDWKKVLRTMETTAKFPMLLGKNQNVDKQLQRVSTMLNVTVDPKVAALRPRVFFEISIHTNTGYVSLGKMYIELYNDIVPDTVAIFLEHCNAKKAGPSFLHKYFNKIIPDEYCELGELPLRMKRPTSLYYQWFPQENFFLKHSKTGILSLAKKGKNMNNLQVSIVFKEYPKFDEERVAFGKIYKGNKLLLSLQEIGKENGAPSEKVIISNCGVVKMQII